MAGDVLNTLNTVSSKALSTILVSGISSAVSIEPVLRVLMAHWQRSGQRQVHTLDLPELMVQGQEVIHDVDLAQLWRSLCEAQHAHDVVCVTSSGGMGTPITRDTTIAALARDWRLPVVLVVPVRWSAIDPTVTALTLARTTKVNVLGIVLIPDSASPDGSPPVQDLSSDAMADILRSLAQAPIIGSLPCLSDGHDEHALARIASNLMLDVVLGDGVMTSPSAPQLV